MSSWRRISIGELGTVVTGRTPPSAQKHLFSGSIPFLTPTDIDGENRFVVPGRFVSAEWNEQQKRISLPPKTVCVVCIGATIGKVCMTATTSNSNQQINSIIVDQTRFDPYFVYYRMRLMRDELKRRAAGAATPIVNKTVFSEISIDVPPLPVQRRIGSILGAYDDLIEVNRRRTAVLEEIAQKLFEEWFVHLRFPGHEGVRMVETQAGPRPDEWQESVIGDFVEFKTGFPFKSETFSASGEHRIVTIGNVQDGAFNPESDSRIDELPSNLPHHCHLSDGDILISLTGNVGRICVVYNGPFLLNQRVATLVPREPIDRMFVYCFFRQVSTRTKLELISNGVAQQNLSPIVASKLPFLVPARELRVRFDNLTRSILAELLVLQNADIRYAASRDLLLPPLMSGDLSLAAAERELETAA